MAKLFLNPWDRVRALSAELAQFKTELAHEGVARSKWENEAREWRKVAEVNQKVALDKSAQVQTLNRMIDTHVKTNQRLVAELDAAKAELFALNSWAQGTRGDIRLLADSAGPVGRGASIGRRSASASAIELLASRIDTLPVVNTVAGETFTIPEEKPFDQEAEQ